MDFALETKVTTISTPTISANRDYFSGKKMPEGIWVSEGESYCRNSKSYHRGREIITE